MLRQAIMTQTSTIFNCIIYVYAMTRILRVDFHVPGNWWLVSGQDPEKFYDFLIEKVY